MINTLPNFYRVCYISRKLHGDTQISCTSYRSSWILVDIDLGPKRTNQITLYKKFTQKVLKHVYWCSQPDRITIRKCHAKEEIERHTERSSPKQKSWKIHTCRFILPCQKDPNEYAEQREYNRYKKSWCNPIDHFHTSKYNKAKEDSHNNPINLQVMWTWTFYPLNWCDINICDSLCIDNMNRQTNKLVR